MTSHKSKIKCVLLRVIMTSLAQKGNHMRQRNALDDYKAHTVISAL